MKVEFKSSMSQLENSGKIRTSRMDQAEVDEDSKIKLSEDLDKMNKEYGKEH